MKLALYLGCTIQSEQYAFEISVRRTLPRLGIDLIDMEGSSCCGFPLRSINVLSWIYLSARNLAISEKLRLNILPICNGCHLSLCEVRHYLEENRGLKQHINSLLSIEGLNYTGKNNVIHLLEVLRDVVGIEKIRGSVKKPLEGLRLAAHYGCHAIMPSKLGRPDDPNDPHTFEELINALGASAEDYPERLDCCGASLAISAGETAFAMAGLKLKAVKSYGFDGMVTICPFCMNMYDARQEAIKAALHEESINLPVLYYTQLLGLSMGIDAEKLGLNLNLSPVNKILEKLEGNK